MTISAAMGNFVITVHVVNVMMVMTVLIVIPAPLENAVPVYVLLEYFG
jgi:hypothetical protein